MAPPSSNGSEPDPNADTEIPTHEDNGDPNEGQH